MRTDPASPRPTQAGQRLDRPPFGWRGLLLWGGTTWIALIVAMLLTRNPALLPAIVLIGAGLVPLAVVLRNGQRLASTGMVLDDLLYAFLAGGIVGFLLGGVFDAEVKNLLGLPAALLLAGFVEEAAKAVALLVVARRVPARSPRAGIYLGAAVGGGVAMLETMFYALRGLLLPHPEGLIRDFPDVVLTVAATEMFRGVLSPFLHITWAAILGGVLFAATRAGRFRLTSAVAGTYLLVALLHSIWDGVVPGIAVTVGRLVDERLHPITHPTGDWTAVQGHVDPAATAAAFAVLTVGYGLVILIGLLVLWQLTRWARRREDGQMLGTRPAPR